MSAVEFVPTPQMLGELSRVSFENPRAKVLPTRYDGLGQFSLSVASRRMQLLIGLSGFQASDEAFEALLTQLAPKLRRVMASDLTLFGLWNSEDEQFQVQVFDTNGDLGLSPDYMGETFWNHVLSTSEIFNEVIG